MKKVLSPNDNSSLIDESSVTDQKKKSKQKVKSVVAMTYDDDVQDADYSINNELSPKKKHKKKKSRHAEREFEGSDENNINVQTHDSNGINDCPGNNVTLDVTNEPIRRKKNRKKNGMASDENDICLSDDGIKSEFSEKKKKKKHYREEATSVQNENFTEELDSSSIKKSKKKRKNIERVDEAEITTERARILLRKDSFHYDSSNSNDKKEMNIEHELIENHIEADNQSVEVSTIIKQESTKKKKKKNGESQNQREQEPTNEISQYTTDDSDANKEKPQRKIKRERNISTSSETSNSSKQQEVVNPKNNDVSSNNTRKHTITADGKGQERRKSSSENIRFEDDNSESARVSDRESVNSEYNEYNNNDKFGKVLEHFKTLKIDKLLFDSNLQISSNHDLFLLKCPRNFVISQLVGASIDTVGKSKLKMENKIYECIFENNEKQHHTFISPAKKSGEYRLRSIKTQGEMRLRRKLPKPNVANHMVAVKHHTFMPLPDTKRRHPLFGIEYKPMIKMQKQVAERLQEAQTITTTQVKKKKKVKPELTDLDISIKKNKKRKRKASDSESITEVAVKKLKRDPGKCDEKWGSEKNIEQSLFADL